MVHLHPISQNLTATSKAISDLTHKRWRSVLKASTNSSPVQKLPFWSRGLSRLPILLFRLYKTFPGHSRLPMEDFTATSKAISELTKEATRVCVHVTKHVTQTKGGDLF